MNKNSEPNKKSNAETAFNKVDLSDYASTRILKNMGRDLLKFSQRIVTQNSTLDWRIKVLSIETGYAEEFIYKCICTFLYESVSGGMII